MRATSYRPDPGPPKYTVLDLAKVSFEDGLIVNDLLVSDSNNTKVRVQDVATSLEVTRYQPSHNVWMHFTKQEDADAAMSFLQRANVNGSLLSCTIKAPDKAGAWSVQIANITQEVTDKQLKALFPPNTVKPAKIVHGKALYEEVSSPVATITKRIEQETRRKIRCDETVPLKKNIKGRAVFTFEGSPNLGSLARKLEREQIPKFGQTKIFVTERVRVVVLLDRHSYKPGQLKAMAREKYDNDHVKIHIDDASMIDGLKPVRITIGPSPTEVVMEAKAVITVCANAPAMSRTLTEVAPKPAPSHRIRLTKTSNYRHVTTEGLAVAERAVGPGKVRLNEESNPPAIEVQGGVATLRKVQVALFPNNDKYAKQLEELACTICCTNDQEHVQLPSCDHVCCTDCFSGYCRNENGLRLPLTCFQLGCNTLIPVRLLRSALSEDAFQQLAKHAVKEYVAKHPGQHAQCPGPDCDMVFRVGAVVERHICPRCFTVSCTNCKAEMHDGETCAECKYREEGHMRALEEYLRQGNAKRCKRCDTIIQKNLGCNHMTCAGCKSHMCWLCMQIFGDADAVYNHLYEKHGGYGDGEAEEQADEIDRVHAELEGLRRRVDDPVDRAVARRVVEQRLHDLAVRVVEENEELGF
ncbi:hypothetical protein BAUCODRAFT_270429 [Baudoinia panamericana UAMH 10762]|uniref:RING-type domain-containing protein n=1 Tax=Baudoinia panamericana (strain UAMH 10762) TaxID=717646 RepID=M2LG62_BAUPA|nr:uncharacterized protein BAUCODRAFT_270429 [Baudoinia panamericana UAMH 10762]EMC93012.1 hypothetical protein BAUCODRAFT_270429 [Baudoinia panamericana UAMH 10762]